jgi:malonyl-CoA O-methyltransferase
VGCGTGVLTAMIADAFPRARIEAVDIAPGLVATARFHFAAQDRIRCLVADARRFSSSVRFPLIVSNASLHWMEPLSDTFKNLARIVTSNGHLAFSIMLSGTLAELREARLRIAPHKPPRARLPTEETVLQALDTAGFVVLEKEVLSLKTEYPSARDLFDGIHHLGVTGGPLSQSAPQVALLTRKELTSLLADYAKHYSRGDGGVWASFEVMYVLAKPAA